MLSRLIRMLTSTTRVARDVNAVRRGRVVQRVVNRQIGKALGKATRKLWR